MRKMYEEFKEFAIKGNLVEIAIGLVLALAFKDVITSLVDNVLTPIVAAIFGQPDFSRLSIDIGESAVRLRRQALQHHPGSPGGGRRRGAGPTRGDHSAPRDPRRARQGLRLATTVK